MSDAMRPHEELEELIVADSLGGLDEDGRREMARTMAEHGPDCPECLRLTTQYAVVAEHLALSVDSFPLTREEEDKMLRAIREDQEVAGRRKPGRGRRRWITSVAAAALIAAVGGAIGYSLAPDMDSRQAAFIAFASQPDSQVVAFPGSDGQQLAVAFRPGSRQGWVFGTNLPRPQGDRVYELWFSSRLSEGVEPAGTFLPEDGVILAPVTVGESPDLLAVSIEPRGGSPQPTTDPILVIEISGGPG